MVASRRRVIEALTRHRWVVGGGLLLTLLGLSATLLRDKPEQPAINLTATHDRLMVAVIRLISSGDLQRAAAQLDVSYRFDQRPGLIALRQFSMAVLQRGLSEKDPFERLFAASALAHGGSPRGVHLLERTIRDDPDLSLKMAAADGLGDIGDARALGILQRLYYSAGDVDRHLIVNGISEVNQPAAVRVLSDAASSSNPVLRLAGLEGLGKLGNARAAPLLRRVMSTGETPIERTFAARSLLQIGKNADLNLLGTLLAESRNGDARPIAALALGYANDSSMVPILIHALSDDDLDVRIGAAAALTHYRQPTGVQYLKQVMVNADDSISRQHVAQVLEQVAFDGGYDVLLTAAGSPDPNLQMSGLHALGLKGGAKEVELMDKMLPHVADPLMRAQIAWSIGRIGTANGIEILIRLVQEHNAPVCYTAADALDRIALRLLGEDEG